MHLKIAGFVFSNHVFIFCQCPIINSIACSNQSGVFFDVRLRRPKSQPCYDGPIMACSQEGCECGCVEKMYY